jgi:hypothetical protein
MDATRGVAVTLFISSTARLTLWVLFWPQYMAPATSTFQLKQHIIITSYQHLRSIDNLPDLNTKLVRFHDRLLGFISKVGYSPTWFSHNCQLSK